MPENALKGYCVPDEQLRKDKGYDELENMYTSDPIIFSSINYLASSLFNLKREEHFDVVCSNPDWRKFLSELFTAYHPPEGLYGHSYDLVSFFEGVLKSLLIFGKAYHKIDFKQTNQGTDARWTIQRLRWLPVETMAMVVTNGKLQRFTQQYSRTCSERSLRGVKVDLEPEEVFVTEWIFDGLESRGISPLIQLIPDVKRTQRFLVFMERGVYAVTHPQDHSHQVERVRYASLDEEKKINDMSQTRIKATLGMMSDAPMTEYYEVYQFCRNRKKMANIRDYLLHEFSVQIVDNLLKKNHSAESARITLRDYMSADEIEALFRKYEKGQLTRDAVWNALSAEMM